MKIENFDACECRDCYEKANSTLKVARIALLTIVTLFAIFLFLFLSSRVRANSFNDARAVNAIIGEAEGEPYRGKLAVACAIRNRGTLRGVYGEKAPRVKNHLYSQKVKADATRAWEESEDLLTCQFIDGADHWEGTKFPTPHWAENMKVTATIGNQRFYRYYKQSEEQEQIDRRRGL